MLNHMQEWTAPEGVVDAGADADAEDAAGGTGTAGCCSRAARAVAATGEVWPLDNGHLEAC